MKKSPNYAKGKFRNLYRIAPIRFGKALMKWLSASARTTPRKGPPVLKRAQTDFDVRPTGEVRVTWLGHSTLIIELDGRRFLTDPVWSNRVSPSPVVGPTRFFPPPLPFAELPRVDAVIISHDHYDHLDMPTIRRLAKTSLPFVVPLGVGAHLEYWGVDPSRITELDWWEETTVRGVKLVATPARHGSGRGLSDRNRTLWAGYALLGPRHRAYFSGDSGYSPTYAEIGRRFGPFDITMIEAGAYNDLWRDFHMGPEQAVRAHQDLRGQVLLPIHWGTFRLALHAWTEPAERIVVAAAHAGVTVALPQPGGSVLPAAPGAVLRWWPKIPWRTAKQEPLVATKPLRRLPMTPRKSGRGKQRAAGTL